MLVCKNFTVAELACKHCGENKCQDEMVRKLQELRDDVNFPIKISSGYRCPEHNVAVGGHPKSSHMEGLAIDIACSGEKALKIVEAAIRLNWVGVGISQRGSKFVHLDLKKTPTKRLWSYA